MPILGAGSFNGLSFGPLTKVHVSTITGVDDLPDVASVDISRNVDPGMFTQQDLPQGRSVVIDFAIIGDTPSDYDAQVTAFKAAMLFATTDSALNLYAGTRTIFARARKRVLPYEAFHLQRTGLAHVEFHASDPRIYEGSNTVAATAAGAALPQALAVTNNGTFETRGPGGGVAGVVVTGPLNSGWSLTNANDSNRALTVNQVLTAGQTVTIDLDLKTIIFGGNNIRSALAAGSLWFKLRPGANALTLAGAGGGAATQLQVTYRGAFI